jgi:hypothetical protein
MGPRNVYSRNVSSLELLLKHIKENFRALSKVKPKKIGVLNTHVLLLRILIRHTLPYLYKFNLNLFMNS